MSIVTPCVILSVTRRDRPLGLRLGMPRCTLASERRIGCPPPMQCICCTLLIAQKPTSVGLVVCAINRAGLRSASRCCKP